MRTPKVAKIGWLLTEIFKKNKRWTFLFGHSVVCVESAVNSAPNRTNLGDGVSFHDAALVHGVDAVDADHESAVCLDRLGRRQPLPAWAAAHAAGQVQPTEPVMCNTIQHNMSHSLLSVIC